MKQLLLLFVLLLAGGAGAQPVSELTYEYVNAGLGEKRIVTLLVSGKEMLSRMSASDTAVRVNEDFRLAGDDAPGRQVYRNVATGELIVRDFVSREGVFEPCLVSDPLKYEWTFVSETKKIGPYDCQRATTSFRGRTYYAWYCEEVAVPFGPWKFSGLPGAIVLVSSDDDLISFRLLKISKGRGTVSRPGQAREITMLDYVHLREGSTQDFIKRLSAQLPRGAQLSLNSVGDYNLETSFTDVKR